MACDSSSRNIQRPAEGWHVVQYRRGNGSIVTATSEHRDGLRKGLQQLCLGHRSTVEMSTVAKATGVAAAATASTGLLGLVAHCAADQETLTEDSEFDDVEGYATSKSCSRDESEASSSDEDEASGSDFDSSSWTPNSHSLVSCSSISPSIIAHSERPA